MQSSSSLASHTVSRKVVVLLVDDQAIVGEAVRRMLSEQSDIDFHFCVNPFEAFDKAADLKPTVILQDLVMPDIEGLALCPVLSRQQCHEEYADYRAVIDRRSDYQGQHSSILGQTITS